MEETVYTIPNKVIVIKKKDIPRILPSSVVTVIPTGAKTSKSFPFSPFRARTLLIHKIQTKPSNDLQPLQLMPENEDQN